MGWILATVTAWVTGSQRVFAQLQPATLHHKSVGIACIGESTPFEV